MPNRSPRSRLRAFQAIHGGAPASDFLADLHFLENRDLDLSVRLGALLAFNALMVTIGTHPVSASPGAPLSLDTARQPWETLASLGGILPFLAAAVLALRAMLVGEEFETEGEEEAEVLRQRLLAAYVRSIAAQDRLLRWSVYATLAGGGLTAGVWGWILLARLL
jgi:hypothetical protein